MEQVYEAEIKLLQEEIALLQNQQENNEREVILHIEEHTQRTLTSQPNFKRGKNDAVMNLEKLEEDLARQTKINGIVLKECEVKTLEKSRTKIVQRYRVSGNCSFLNFQVEFELTEIQEEDGTIVRRITALNIVVDGCELIDISTFVSGVEETKSLLLFFRALRAFSERCEQRSRTFAHFKVTVVGRQENGTFHMNSSYRTFNQTFEDDCRFTRVLILFC
ncbi:centromere protein P [Anguilla anguilla]|uniref:centromere protein P n=1 Tax=Anguilla anguilla TaxID=7936 RepID=UPI0015AA4633|nr:centromere protein P [Anguilla anguilla]